MHADTKILSSKGRKRIRSLSRIKFKLKEEKNYESNVLVNYLKYKEILLNNKFSKQYNRFLNPFMFLKKNNSTSILSLQNSHETTKRKKVFNFNNKNNVIKNRNISAGINHIISRNNNKSNEEKRESKFKPKYKLLMRNLSFIGNGKKSFRNLSNEVLDELFEDMPFSSIVTPQFKKVSFTFKRNSFKNKSRNSHSTIDKNNYTNKLQKDNNKYKKIKEIQPIYLSNFKNIENMHNERTPNSSRNSGKNLVFNSSNHENEKEIIHSKKSDKVNYGYKFHLLKMKLRKQSNVTTHLINDIKKEQSLGKHKILVGIVQLNGYRPKNRLLKTKLQIF
jgi:hypothetical protein